MENSKRNFSSRLPLTVPNLGQTRYHLRMAYDPLEDQGVRPGHHQIPQNESSQVDVTANDCDFDVEFKNMFADELSQIRSTKSKPATSSTLLPAQPSPGQSEHASGFKVQSEDLEHNAWSAAGLDSERVIQNGKAHAKPRGRIREVSGGLIEHFATNTGSWHPAVYHEDIRGALIEEASQLGHYDYPQNRGAAPNDITSYLPSQKEWGPDRERSWPNVLHRVERKGLSVPDYQVRPLYYNGRVVLDLDSHPVLNYVDLPATLSTEFSGQHMEAITRIDPRISHNDFRVRMPNIRRIGQDGQTIRLSYSLGAIGMRMSRFRRENRLLAWKLQEGSQNTSDFPVSKLPKENITANSTEKTRKERDAKGMGKLAKLRTARLEATNQGLDELQSRIQGQDQEGQIQVGTKRKRAKYASPDMGDDVQSVNKRSKTFSAVDEVRLVSKSPPPSGLSAIQESSVPPAKGKRSREESSVPEDDYELRHPKRRSNGSRSVLREPEIHVGQDWSGSHGVESADFNTVPVGLQAPVASMVPHAPVGPDALQGQENTVELEEEVLSDQFNLNAEDFATSISNEEIPVSELTELDHMSREAATLVAGITFDPEETEVPMDTETLPPNVTSGNDRSTTLVEPIHYFELPPSNNDPLEPWFLEYVRDDV